jgi:cardiolipin synthase
MGSRIFVTGIFALALFAMGCRAPRLQIRQQIAVSAGITNQAFRDSLGGALHTPFLSSNRITPLVNGDQFVPAMIAAIRSASNSINLETFIWKSGRMSDEFIDALVERAQRGVEVRCIADGLGTYRLTGDDRARLETNGVHFVRYNKPRLLHPGRLNFRDHRKLLIVDGRTAFTGGYCIGDKWLGNAETLESWRDTMVQVEGPVVAQFQSAFAANWLEVTGEVIFGEKFYPTLETAGTAFAQNFISGPHEDAASAEITYLSAIAAARQRVLIEHSYFVPDELSLAALREARRRGVVVEVIAPGRINFNIVRRASRTLWPELLRAGVKIYEYGPAKLHCKILIVDNAFVSIGSVNFDERSFRINDESNINVIDPDFGARMAAQFEADKAQSRAVTLPELKRTPWSMRAFEHFAALFRAQL